MSACYAALAYIITPMLIYLNVTWLVQSQARKVYIQDMDFCMQDAADVKRSYTHMPAAIFASRSLSAHHFNRWISKCTQQLKCLKRVGFVEPAFECTVTENICGLAEDLVAYGDSNVFAFASIQHQEHKANLKLFMPCFDLLICRNNSGLPNQGLTPDIMVGKLHLTVSYDNSYHAVRSCLSMKGI